MDHLAALRATDLFYNLSEAQLERVAALCQERSLAQGEMIFDEEAPASELFVVAAGQVEISLGGTHAADNVVLTTLGPGQAFGEMSLIDHCRRSANARSLTEDSRLLAISHDALMRLCEQDTDLGFRLMRNIARELVLRIRTLDLNLHDRVFWNAADAELQTMF